MAKLPTLTQIANRYKTLAVARAPRKTGNLKRRITTYNTPSKMIKKRGKLGFELFLDVSPPDAEYGKYWNRPYGEGNGRTAKLKARYPQHFDFDAKAYESNELRNLIYDYVDASGYQLLQEEVDKLFLESKDLFTIS